MTHVPVRHFFTVEVEDYFQDRHLAPYVPPAAWDQHPSRVERNVDSLLGLLSDAGARATFFTSGWTAQRFPRLIRAIARQGHELASYGDTSASWHPLTPVRFREEVSCVKKLLEDVSATQVIGYRARGFTLRASYEWAFDVLLEESYEYDSSRIQSDRSDRSDTGRLRAATPRYPHAVACESVGGSLLEIPVTPLTLWPGASRSRVAGGASLRHLPYPVVRNAFRRAERDGVPGVFCLHPWELDSAQPRMRVPLAARVRHYGGLTRTAPRLGRLLAEFRFGSIAASLPHLVQNAPAIAA